MSYLYHGMEKTKSVAATTIHKVLLTAHYQRSIKAVRLDGGQQSAIPRVMGRKAASRLPKITPALSEQGYTGCVLVGFRVTGGQGQLETLRQRINLFPQTLLSFVGSSGCSLKVVMPCTRADGSLPAEDAEQALFHQHACARVTSLLWAATGVRPEEVEDGMHAYARMSMDKRAYLNLQVEPIRLPQPAEALRLDELQPLQHPEAHQAERLILPNYDKTQMDTTKFNMICRELAFGRLMAPNEHILQVAARCCSAGIEPETTIHLMLAIDDYRHRETFVRSSVENVYCHHRMGKANPIERIVMHQQLFRQFLFRRYRFRRNGITDEVEYKEKTGSSGDWLPLTREARNDFNIAALDAGIRVWDKDVDRLLASHHIVAYDPVGEWLSALPHWDGNDRLGMLAKRVKTEMPAWEENFKIWMRAMVRQWMGGNQQYGAQMVLMLIGAQGTHKSTFMRLLLPEALRSFYTDRIDFANRKDALRALSRFLLISIGEYDQVSGRQMAYLKHLIQRTDIVERRMYETTYQQRRRYAAFAATTNNTQVLKDDTGSRRYLCVEVSKPIDTDVSMGHEIDYLQLYAQIKAEIARRMPCHFDGERERSICRQNSYYSTTPLVVSIFCDQYHKPREGEQTVLMSPTEILETLRKNHKGLSVSQSTCTTLGAYLQRNHFMRGSGYNRRRYLVATND